MNQMTSTYQSALPMVLESLDRHLQKLEICFKDLSSISDQLSEGKITKQEYQKEKSEIDFRYSALASQIQKSRDDLKFLNSISI